METVWKLASYQGAVVSCGVYDTCDNIRKHCSHARLRQQWIPCYILSNRHYLPSHLRNPPADQRRPFAPSQRPLELLWHAVCLRLICQHFDPDILRPIPHRLTSAHDSCGFNAFDKNFLFLKSISNFNSNSHYVI